MFINLCRNIYQDLELLEQRLSPATDTAWAWSTGGSVVPRREGPNPTGWVSLPLQQQPQCAVRGSTVPNDLASYRSSPRHHADLRRASGQGGPAGSGSGARGARPRVRPRLRQEIQFFSPRIQISKSRSLRRFMERGTREPIFMMSSYCMYSGLVSSMTKILRGRKNHEKCANKSHREASISNAIAKTATLFVSLFHGPAYVNISPLTSQRISIYLRFANSQSGNLPTCST